ncbi:MAG: FecR family protein [Carboxylicivirga sp.]|nr:FecR family protein [Carboxylicivirga sp.]
MKEWLEKPSNRFQFDNTTSGKTFTSKIEFYQRKDTYSKWLELHTEIKKRKKRKIWMWVAAVLILPLSVSILLFESGNVEEDKDTINQIAKVDEVVLTTSMGETHQLVDVDTIMKLGASQVVITSGEIAYTEHEKSKETEYNTLDVPVGLTYKLILPDKSTVWLNSNTQLRYPAAFTKNQRKIYLAQGEIYLDVSKNKSKPFIVNMGNENIEVLGTKFNVKHYEEDGQKVITLQEGSIEIERNLAYGEETNSVQLMPNQQAVISGNKNPINVSNVDASLYTAWIDNIFRYENERLENILNDLSRHYNLRIFYQNQSCKNIEYSLRLSKDKKVEEILNVIELLGVIEFEKNKNNITVIEKM